MSDALIAASEEVRQKLRLLASELMADQKMTELRKLLIGLNTLEDLCNQPKTNMLSFFDLGEHHKSEISISPDEFYGLDALEAAKRYLKKRGKSAPFREIVAAIKAGGGDPGGEDRLRLSLARSTWEIAKVSDDVFGLLEFYPHIKRGAKKKKNGTKEDGLGAEEETPESLVETDGDSASAPVD